jgi:acyl-coenzyme A thioesterase PaaI-like protein
VEQAARVLAERSHGRRYSPAEASLAEIAESGVFINDSPFVGRLNPLASPIAVRYEADGERGPAIVGVGRFGAAYEGPPGCVHGGVIAGSFDEILGLTQSMTGQPGMTAHLEIDYRSPTPLHRELRFEGRILRVEGRKIFTEATLHHGEVLCAQAAGLFLSMRPDVLDRLMRSRAQRDG